MRSAIVWAPGWGPAVLSVTPVVQDDSGGVGSALVVGPLCDVFRTGCHLMFQRVDPVRQEGPLFGRRRAVVRERCDQLADSIADLDRRLGEISAERRRLALELKVERRRLWPVLSQRGRQPATDGREQLPAVRQGATFLWGRRLRAACVALLSRFGPMALPELHALLHRCHLAVAGTNPVKALADALGHEHDAGRARRIRRGVYRASAESVQRWSAPARRLWPGGPVIGEVDPASLG